MQKNGTTSELEGRLDSLKENVRNLVDAGSERAAQLKDRAVGAKDTLVENGEVALNRISALIKAHPIAAIGIAFSVGYVAIRMLRK
jgi:ElaB/YqjD/DUF883 family membrane-anchored ribosome-binding protein